ncbi:hypothetical protein PAE4_20051 [Bacillus altitudinis]|nr:hypothetical protein PAE4_20051 [Bacillus altitudinis]
MHFSGDYESDERVEPPKPEANLTSRMLLSSFVNFIWFVCLFFSRVP